jgi:hypothetical protein
MRRYICCGVILGVLGWSASALAHGVTPHTGSWYGETKPAGGKDDEAEFIVKDNQLTPQRMSPGWTAIIAPTSFTCNEAYIQLTAKSVKISNGHFFYKGQAVDTAGGKSTGIVGQLTWSGAFTSPTTVRGTVRFQTTLTPVWHRESYTYSLEQKPCDTGTLDWAGKVGARF